MALVNGIVQLSDSFSSDITGSVWLRIEPAPVNKLWKKQAWPFLVQNLPPCVIVCRKVGTSPAASSFFAHIVVACAPIACAQQLSLPAESSAAGGSVLISAAFAPGSGPVSGLQFDLQYDSSAMSLVATTGDAARSSGKSLYYSDLNPNQRRFVLAGSDQNPIPAGMLVNLFVLVTPNASTGAHALILTNLSSVSPTGSSAPITGTNGSVSVTIGTGSRLESTGVLNAASLNAGAVAPERSLP